MKLQTLFFAIFTLAIVMSSCTKDQVTPSQNITKVDMYFSDYHKLDVSGTFEVFVKYSDFEETVEIEANENLHKFIIAEQKGDRLIIKLKNNTRILGNNEVMRVYITTKNIEDFDVSGVSTIELQSLTRTTDLGIKLSGNSTFLGKVETDNLTTKIDGNSKLSLAGTANQLKITASGASEIEHFDLVANDVDMNLAGACIVSLTVNDEIRINATGNCKFYYKGSGKVVKQSLSGNSTVEKLN